MRLFVAVELPEALRAQLGAGVERLRRELPSARWVRCENVHITLAFLGEVDAGAADAVATGLASAALGLAPTVVAPMGGGFFPSRERPRVAWVGGDCSGLVPWAAAVARVAEASGIAVDHRPFSLHLTVARLSRPWRPSEVQRFLDRVGSWTLPAFTARELVLFSSELRPGGSRYTAIGRWPVTGGG